MVFLGLAIIYLLYAASTAILKFCPARLHGCLLLWTIQIGQVALLGLVGLLHFAEYLLSHPG